MNHSEVNYLQELANAVRMLSVDAVEQAQSGHPGMPLGMADIATVLWQKFLNHNPRNPQWFNRDRFVLSNGHGSMLLYAILHLSGYALSIEELKNFRQLNSKTPGHPEYGATPGVETTTGPLGQGLGNAVGMAIAEKVLAATFNRSDLALVNHYTYVFAGDGCLMEGISHETCSLAGTLSLGKLIVFYDSNDISIDGNVSQWFTDDTLLRFTAYNWQVIGPINGHDAEEITISILTARANIIQPTLIICKTVIGYGSALAGSEKCHGSPLGAEMVNQLRINLNWGYPPFFVPEELYLAWNHIDLGQRAEGLWTAICLDYSKKYPTEYQEFLRRIDGILPTSWKTLSQNFILECAHNAKALATRKCSQLCLEEYGKALPELFGGSADLTASNNTDWSGSVAVTADNLCANYLFYGVREFGMATIMNGMAVHRGFIPYGGTFLVFADYARNAIRLSSLMHQRVIYVFTHDSVALGEDGPTHQPIEHASMLRMTPGLDVWRPADLVETAVAWQQMLQRQEGPSALLLSRQNLPALAHAGNVVESIARGGYIISDCLGLPDVIILATGSEVALAIDAVKHISSRAKYRIRIVSMLCCERFLEQDAAYKEAVLPHAVRKRVAVEAAASNYWYRFIGLDGVVVGIDRFGVSAPGAVAMEYLNVTVENLVQILDFLCGESK